jgi:type VI secretion system secreted protein VgrG
VAKLSQTSRPLRVTSGSWVDRLFITNLSGSEGLSQLFTFDLDLIAENGTDIPFDELLGKEFTVRLASRAGQVRFFSGVVSRFSQGASDADFTTYQARIVPKFWFLTRTSRSRIFQQITVPDILKKVLAGLSPTFDLKGRYEPRDYCVQYRETDFNFAGRLMEEEGMYYYFKHSDAGHEMVVADAPSGHVELTPAVTYASIVGANPDEDRIYGWWKTQELRSGQVTLWDHTFEIPHKHLEAEKKIVPSVAVGAATHKLAVGGNDVMELYDFPGEYAQRFDGIDPGGGERPGDIQKVFEDNARTAGIRMEQEAVQSLSIWGRGNCPQLFAGARFTLKALGGDAKGQLLKADGQYVLTTVHHTANQGQAYRGGDDAALAYTNEFTCLPRELPFRPQRSTPKPIVQGSQTAVVVGPRGEEIFTDKFGRVKLQFHWDREGKNDLNSSCWVRVGTAWAGRGWGIYAIPRVGQEVIVDFLEGDPDQPIVVGNVFNADQMPAYKLPDERTKSWIKTNSSPGGVGFNEVRFEDKKGSEQIFIHGERNQDVRIKNDCMENVMHDRHLTVGEEKDGGKVGKQNEEVFVDKNLTVHRNHTEHVGGNMQLLVGGIDGVGNQHIVIKLDKKELIGGHSDLKVLKDVLAMIDGYTGVIMKGDLATKVGGNHDATVGGAQTLSVGGHQSETVGGDCKFKAKGKCSEDIGADLMVKIGGSSSHTIGSSEDTKVGSKFAVEAGQEVHIKAGMKLILEAGAQLSLKGPGGFIDIGPAGVAIQGTMVLINSGGAAGSGSGASPTAPEAPDGPRAPREAQPAEEAKPEKPVQADDATTGNKSN